MIFSKKSDKSRVKTAQILLFISFLIAMNLSIAQTSGSAPFRPDLSTDQKKLEWLIQARNTIPGLFSQAVTYDINLMQLLDQQEWIQTQLKAQQQASSTGGTAEEQKLLAITLAQKEEQVVNESRIKPEAILEWKKNLEQTVRSLDPTGTLDKISKQDIEIKISELQKWLNNRSSQGLETGLIMSLPPEERKALLQLSSEERLKALKDKLPDTIATEFKGAAHGLNGTVTKKEALAMLVQMKGSEKGILDLLELHLVLQNNEGVIDVNPITKINSLTSSDLDFFTDPDALKERLGKIEMIKKSNGAFQKFLWQGIQKSLKKFSSQLESIEAKVKSLITLKEVPPAMGIFRGCVGGDCSTMYSFAYPNASSEKVFYIYDENGAHKGYVTGQLVEVNGKKSFRVITISGARISSNDTRLILNGLTKIKEQLGATQIVLPTEQNLDGLINYTPIREELEKVIKDQQTAGVKYLDKEERKIIEEFKSENNSAEYDLMKKNSQAIVYNPTNEDSLRMIEVKAELTTFTPKKLTEEELRKDALRLMMDLRKSHRDDQIPRILMSANYSASDQEKLLNEILNKSKEPIIVYQQKMKALFGLNDKELTDQLPMFIEGYLNSPDYTSLMSDPRFLSLVNQELRLNPEHFPDGIKDPELIRKLIDIGDGETMTGLASQVFSNPNITSIPNASSLLDSLIAKSDSAQLNMLIHLTFSQPHSLAFKDQLKSIIEKSDESTKQSIAINVFTKPHTESLEDLLLLLVEKSQVSTHGELLHRVFLQPHIVMNENIKKIIQIILKNADSTNIQLLTKALILNPNLAASPETRELLSILLRKIRTEDLEKIGQEIVFRVTGRLSIMSPDISNLKHLEDMLKLYQQIHKERGGIYLQLRPNDVDYLLKNISHMRNGQLSLITPYQGVNESIQPFIDSYTQALKKAPIDKISNCQEIVLQMN